MSLMHTPEARDAADRAYHLDYDEFTKLTALLHWELSMAADCALNRNVAGVVNSMKKAQLLLNKIGH